MATSTIQNPAEKPESKSAKKKKSKPAAAETPVPAAPVADPTTPAESSNGDGSYESPYIKELYK